MMDSIPIVALTGQVPAALIGKDGFQEADTIGISLPSTKQSFAIARRRTFPRYRPRLPDRRLGPAGTGFHAENLAQQKMLLI